MRSLKIPKIFFLAPCLGIFACVTDPEAIDPREPLSFIAVSCELRELAPMLPPQWRLLVCKAHNRADKEQAVAFTPVLPEQHPYLALASDADLRALEKNFVGRTAELQSSSHQTIAAKGHAKFQFPLLSKSQRRPAYVELSFTQPVSGSKTVPISMQSGEQRRRAWPSAPEVGP